MKYRDAKKIKAGDIVVTKPVGTRRRVVSVEVNEDDKAVFASCDDGVCYYHDAIQEIEAPDKKHNKYYQILAFNPADKPDAVCSSHIYPSYVSCMTVKGHMSQPVSFNDLYGHPLMLQSNPHDGLKFIDLRNAEKMVSIAKNAYPEKEFEIISMNTLFYGRVNPRWVVDL